MLEADEIARVLLGAGVDFIIVGGLAVGAHGFVRATKDMDIVPNPERSNLRRLASALRELEAAYLDTKDFDAGEFPFDPLKVDDLAQGGNFVMSTRHGRLDVLQWISGVPGDLAFDHLSAGAQETDVFGMTVRVCSYDDLVAMKRAAGRSQDIEDLKNLGESV